MPLYEFKCEECVILWEHWYREIPRSQPKYRMCPSCGKRGIRAITTCNVLFGDDMDFTTHRHRVAKWRKEGMDKDSAQNYYKWGIEDTNKRIKQSPYSRMDFDEEHWKKKGATKLTPEEKMKRENIAKQQTLAAKQLLKNKE